MPMNVVLYTLGSPTEVRSGILLNDGTKLRVLVYQVKKQQTEQYITLAPLFPPVMVARKKTNRIIHNNWKGENSYGFLFKNSLLVKFGYLGDDWNGISVEEGDYVSPGASSGQKSKGILKNIPLVGKLF